jgi:hypothetical protein
MGSGPDVYIKEQTGKFFVVEHRYMPTPNVDEPSSFDERSMVTHRVGIAATREDAERLKAKYLKQLVAEAAKDDDED